MRVLDNSILTLHFIFFTYYRVYIIKELTIEVVTQIANSISYFTPYITYLFGYRVKNILMIDLSVVILLSASGDKFTMTRLKVIGSKSLSISLLLLVPFSVQ